MGNSAGALRWQTDRVTTRLPLSSIAAGFRPPGSHVAALTGLRGVAAGWVMVFHLWQAAGQPAFGIGPLDLTFIAGAGYFGVDLFFVLSGYLLGGPFLRARAALAGPPSWRRFWIHRVRRVLPAYWTQLALLCLIAWLAGQGWPLGPRDFLLHAGLLFNFQFNAPALNPVYWSLPVEWNFYLALPLLVALWPRTRGHWLPIVVAVAAAIAFRVLCWWVWARHGEDGIWFARWIIQLPGRVDQFVIGMAVAAIGMRVGLAAHGRWVGAVAVAGVAAIAAYAHSLGDFIGSPRAPWLFVHFTLVALAFGAVVWAAVHAPAGLLARALRSRALVLMGVVSYSVYLWHYPIIGWMVSLKPWLPGTATWALVVALVVLAAAGLSYRLVERPFLARS